MSGQVKKNMVGAMDECLGSKKHGRGSRQAVGLEKKHGGVVDKWLGSKRHGWGGRQVLRLE